jgi:hypothetical protein
MTDTSKLHVSTIDYGEDEIVVGIFATREALLDDLIERFAYLGDDEYPLTHENVVKFINLADVVVTLDIAEYDNPHTAASVEPEPTPVWTITENHDGDVTVSTFGTEEAARAAIRADVIEAAANDDVDIEELPDGNFANLGDTEFLDNLDGTDVGHWCVFIEEHGWKCREYTLSQSTIDLSTKG